MGDGDNGALDAEEPGCGVPVATSLEGPLARWPPGGWSSGTGMAGSVAAGGVPVTVIGSATKVQDDLAADVTAFEQLERLVDLVQWQYAVDGYL